MDIEDITVYDDWIRERVRINGSMSTTFKRLREKLKLTGDIIIINYICRRYKEEGAKVSEAQIRNMLVKSAEYRSTGLGKRAIFEDALARAK